MDSPDAPPAPDYAGAAQATAAGNLQNLNAQTWANRPTQVTPWGSTNWSSSIDNEAYNRALADWQASGSNPQTRPTQNSYTRWQQNLTLTPETQAALDAQQSVQQQRSELAQTVQDQAADTLAAGFDAPSLSSYTSGVPGVQTDFGAFNPTGVRGVNQQTYNPTTFAAGSQPIQQTFGGGPNQQLSYSTGPSLNTAFRSSAPRVDLSAPQFSDGMARDGAKASYEGATALLEDDWAKEAKDLDANLRLQGLMPGTEAYDNAVRNQQRTVEQTRSKLANDAVVTGAGIARDNYSAALSGYRAGNEAQGQQFSQDATGFGLTNDARTTQAGINRDAFSAGNQARSTQFGQNLAGFTATNDARDAAFDRGMSLYGATLEGQRAGNDAQQSAFDQAVTGYGLNMAGTQAENAAADQAWQRALQGYGADYSARYNDYMLPINISNAMLTGQQVQSPNMPSFATAGYTGGADHMGATSALGSWNQGLYNSQVASNNANNSAIAGLGGAALMAFF